MAYSVYWQEQVHMAPKGMVIVGDDGNKKRVLYRKHFMKFNYIPMSDIVGISRGDGELRIEMKDGSEKCDLDYIQFGNMPMSLAGLEERYHETPMELHPLGYYIVDEFVYVNDEMAERLKDIERSRYMIGGYSTKLVDIIKEVEDNFQGVPLTISHVTDIQNSIFRELYNATNGTYTLREGVQAVFNASTNRLDCFLSDEAFECLANNNLL